MIIQFIRKNKRSLYFTFKLVSLCSIFLFVLLATISLLISMITQYQLVDSFVMRLGICLFSVSLGFFSASQFKRYVFKGIEDILFPITPLEETEIISFEEANQIR